MTATVAIAAVIKNANALFTEIASKAAGFDPVQPWSQSTSSPNFACIAQMLAVA
jgi:hypothetical protein